ncbi:MAG: sensor histidine kinase [Alphaproteobacteria bacterium]
MPGRLTGRAVEADKRMAVDHDGPDIGVSTPAAELVDLRDYRPKERLAVLVVEGDEVDFRAMERALDRIVDPGVVTTRAKTGAEAADLLERYPWDIAFVDQRLGDMSGIDLVRRAGGRLARTPLVLVTGQAERTLEDAALRAGAWDFLDKGDLSPSLVRRILRYVCAQHEVTRRLVTAEQKSRDLAAVANAASDAKTRFLAQMSHELRTPLNAILGFAEIVRDNVLGVADGDRAREYAGHIHASGSSLLALINDLLDLAKVESGEFSIAFSEVSAAQAIARSVSSVRPLIEARELEVEIDVPPDLPPLYADPLRLQQMLVNLLSNAIKFTLPGGAITVRAGTGVNEIAIVVADTGIGIPEHALADVTQPFVQVPNALQKPGEGTGLGLALVKSLMERHGGELRLTSIEGTGTTATLAFPAN